MMGFYHREMPPPPPEIRCRGWMPALTQLTDLLNQKLKIHMSWLAPAGNGTPTSLFPYETSSLWVISIPLSFRMMLLFACPFYRSKHNLVELCSFALLYCCIPTAPPAPFPLFAVQNASPAPISFNYQGGGGGGGGGLGGGLGGGTQPQAFDSLGCVSYLCV
jgi:hypothetical protein